MRLISTTNSMDIINRMEQSQTSNSEFFEDYKPCSSDWAEVNDKLVQDLQRQESQTTILSEPFSRSDQSLDEETVQPESSPITSERGRREASDSNYQKNICAYVSKKIVLHLINPKCQSQVRKMCRKVGCSYDQAIEYYTKRSKQIFGITHLCLMMTPQNEEEVGIKKLFCRFLDWFLRNKYMAYVLQDGKMKMKDKYVEFKNKYMLYIVQVEKQFCQYE